MDWGIAPSKVRWARHSPWSLVGQEISLDASVSSRKICRMVCWDFGLVQAIGVKRMSKSGGLIEAGGGESEKNHGWRSEHFFDVHPYKRIVMTPKCDRTYVVDRSHPVMYTERRLHTCVDDLF